MLFNSYLFLFLFLPIVLIGFFALRGKAPFWSMSWIVLASLFYYGWWKPAFLLLLLTSITVNLAFGKTILSGKLSSSANRIVLILGIIFNLCLLGYFKYAGFLITNVNELFHAGLPSPHILLPIGISFITFQKIAFLVDAYRGQVKNFSILNYIFFVTFFPQLIAGPIVHHAEIMPQIANAPRRDWQQDLAIGISIFIIGLFKKVIIADTLSIYADAGYSMLKAGQPLDLASAWITVLCYAVQLYFDFSGYSDMAIGLARLFGIRLPLNFFSPYQATSIIDFWRRWHMTLSRFLRDYLYFPLGGNRSGSTRRYINLFIVMFLGGLWHGANWTFAIWGSIHGFLLTLNHVWRRLPFTHATFYQSKPVTMLSILITFILVTLAWVPFRADNISQAYLMWTYLIPKTHHIGIASLHHFWLAQFTHVGYAADWFKPRELWPTVLPPDYLATMARPVGVLLLLMLFAIFLLPNTTQLFRDFEPTINLSHHETNGTALRKLDARVACILALMLVLSLLKLSHVSPFLYFQF